MFGPGRRVEDPIPFTIPPADDRYGNRHVVQISSGWLVGFDAGEFGGGLWCYPTASAEGARVRPSADAPVHPQDYYKADNVRGFGRVNGELVVLMGLDHMDGRSGRVFQVKPVGPEIVLVPWAVLDGSPSAWAVDERFLFVVTDSSVYSLSPPATATVVHTFSGELGGLYPTSVVRTDDAGAVHWRAGVTSWLDTASRARIPRAVVGPGDCLSPHGVLDAMTDEAWRSRRTWRWSGRGPLRELRVQMTDDAFVEFDFLFGAGHATQRHRYLALSRTSGCVLWRRAIG